MTLVHILGSFRAYSGPFPFPSALQVPQSLSQAITLCSARAAPAAVPHQYCRILVPASFFCHRALLKNPPCAATRILAQYSSRIRARAGSLSTQRQISIPVLVLRTVPVQFTHVSAYRYRSVSCTRTAVGFTGDLQIQSRASLFSARSESNPVLILPLRNRIKTYQ